MSNYRPTIGLEIHAELRTKTKMFCDSKNDPLEPRPNVNVCPVCMAHPGTLPVINREAVMHVLRVGAALGARLADYTEFDRKNYFYPDLPKGYQISQYEFPLVSGGSLAGISVTRVHLEEDTASSIHDESTGNTTIDFNRAGVPLMELVTEPVIHTAEEAGRFARELQLLLRYLGVSEANMEQGQMRVEANVSIAPAIETFASAEGRGHDAEVRRKDASIPRDSASILRGSAVPLGTKVEIKNLNSFKAMERAVAYEIKRQEKLLEEGGTVVQETRGWDENKQATFAQRIKEGSADYRYFPDPDLPSLKLSEIAGCGIDELRNALPELPQARRDRYVLMGLKKDDADLFVRDARLGAFFESVVIEYTADQDKVALAANYIANDLVKILRDIQERDTEIKADVPISAENFNAIMRLLYEKKFSSRAGKDLILKVVQTGRPAQEIAQEEGLFETNSEAGLASLVAKVIDDNPSVVSDYKAGKTAALEYLVGQSMKALRGAGDPASLRQLFTDGMNL